MQAAQQQSNQIAELLTHAQSTADQIHERSDLITTLNLVHKLRSAIPVQPVAGLKPLHITQIKQQLNELHNSIVTAYDKSFLDVQGRIRTQQAAVPPLTTAAALLLAPLLALDHRQGSVPNPISASSAAHIAAAADNVTVYPENVLGELNQVIGLLRARAQGRGDRPAAQALVDMLIAVRTETEPSLNREVPLDRAALRAARLALLGVATRLEVETAPANAVQDCCRCIAGLAVLEMRESGVLTVNEAMVLVREDR